jgi:hypothetical protein
MTEESTVSIVERYIFKAWEEGLTGADVINYVCTRTALERYVVENVFNALIDRMY